MGDLIEFDPDLFRLFERSLTRQLAGPGVLNVQMKWGDGKKLPVLHFDWPEAATTYHVMITPDKILRIYRAVVSELSRPESPGQQRSLDRKVSDYVVAIAADVELEILRNPERRLISLD